MNIYALYTSHRERKMRINYSGVWDLHSHCQVLDERRGGGQFKRRVEAAYTKNCFRKA